MSGFVGLCIYIIVILAFVGFCVYIILDTVRHNKKTMNGELFLETGPDHNLLKDVNILKYKKELLKKVLENYKKKI